MELKPRILYLLKILQERTDDEHPLSTNQIIEILDKEYGTLLIELLFQRM